MEKLSSQSLILSGSATQKQVKNVCMEQLMKEKALLIKRPDLMIGSGDKISQIRIALATPVNFVI